MAVENNKVDETFAMNGSQTVFSVTNMRVTIRVAEYRKTQSERFFASQ